MYLYQYIFQIFSFFAIVSAILVIISKNPVHSVLYLILVFFNSIIILIFLEKDFLAMIFLIVYVGAIAILFLFIVMLLNIKITISNLNILRYIPIAFLFVVIFFIEFKLLLNKTFFFNSVDSYQSTTSYTNWITKLDVYTNIKSIALSLYTTYYDLFIISGLILLLAMIGAISLTFYTSLKTKRQNVVQQLLRVGQLNLYK
jgi:NADH-quinone oxidoreductase subunit J